MLAETLNSCDVTYKDRSRDVESYDYTLGHKQYTENRVSEIDAFYISIYLDVLIISIINA